MIKVIIYFLGIYIALMVGMCKYDTAKSRREKVRWPVVYAMSWGGFTLCLYYWVLILLDHIGLYPD